MLNHHALALLASPKLPSSSSQRTLQLFASHDLSLPHKLIPLELDSRYGWPAGTADKLISRLINLGLVNSLTQRRPTSTNSITLQLAPKYCWTPKSLAEQWQAMEKARERQEMVAPI